MDGMRRTSPPGGVGYRAALAMGPSQVTKLFVATIARWWIDGYGRDAKHSTAWRRWLQGAMATGRSLAFSSISSQKLGDHMTMHIGQPTLDSVVIESQFLVIDS